MSAETRDPDRIYLEPGEGEPDVGRMWCSDDVWTHDPEYAEFGAATEYVRADRVGRLEELVSELADDLESEVLDRWGGEYDDEGVPDTSGMHPAQRSRYERDMEIVHRARAELTETRAEGEG